MVSPEDGRRWLPKCSVCFSVLVAMGEILVNVGDITHVKLLSEMCYIYKYVCKLLHLNRFINFDHSEA
jgi:hypothetical protein